MQVPYSSRPHETGGVVSFIIIGLILTALFVGGIAFIKNRADQPAVPAPETTQQTNEEGAEVAPSETEEESPAPTPAPSESETGRSPAPTAPQTPSSQGTSGEIAATGPVDTFITMIALGLLAAVTTRFIQSRSFAAQQ